MENNFLEKKGNPLKVKRNPWKQGNRNNNSMKNKDVDRKPMGISSIDEKASNLISFEKNPRN